MRAVKITWGDAQHQTPDSWVSKDDVEKKLRKITSIGILVDENSVRYTIAHSYDKANKHYCGLFHIPTSCVTDIEEL